MSTRWFRIVLALCPTAISVLWLAGIARFRELTMETGEWIALAVAAAIGSTVLQVVLRARPLAPLPERANPATIAAFAAGVVAMFALVFGGALELLAGSLQPTHTSLALRTTWHAACAFGVSHCLFLLRLTQPRPPGPDDARRPPG